MKHELKIHPIYFKSVKSGSKTFEVRKMDRPFSVDDELELLEYDNEYSEDESECYTGAAISAFIERIWFPMTGLKEGYGALAIRVVGCIDA